MKKMIFTSPLHIPYICIDMIDMPLGHVIFRMDGIPDENTKHAIRCLTTDKLVHAISNGTELQVDVYSQRGLDRIRKIMANTQMTEVPSTILGLQDSPAPDAPPPPPDAI